MNKIPEKIKIYARLIQKSPVEVLMVFDQDFGLKHSYVGSKHSVPVDKEEQSHWKDHYTLHNHTHYPLSFSTHDILCEARINTKGCFVIRKDGMIDFIGRTSTQWNKEIVNDPIGSPICMLFGMLVGETIFYNLLSIDQVAFPETYNHHLERIMKEHETYFLSEEIGA